MMRIFLRVAELTSFSRAAESLGQPKASVSQAIQQLESLTGARLLQRTTRKVSLTQDGLAFYERCRDFLADLDEIESMFRSGGELVGRLRIDMPSGFAKRLLMTHLPDFLQKHPGLELELSTTDRRVDVIREGFDCVVRVGFSADPGVMVRSLGSLEVINVASRDYLKRYGTPKTLEDLAHHQLIHYAPVLGSKATGFEYVQDGEVRFVPMSGSVTVNNSEAYNMACLAGLGIIQVPKFGIHPDMVEILPEWLCEPMPISLLYPHRRTLPRRLQVFLDWVSGLIQTHYAMIP